MHRTISSKVVFSKQCDHDIGLMPLWLHWYKNIFKADKIIITPVKTPKSSIDKTTEFYESEGLKVQPLYFDSWDDGIVWKAQLDIIKNELNENLTDTLILSADTDQYFSPVSEKLLTRELVFRRIFLYSDQEITPDNIDSAKLFSHSSLDLIAGFYGELDNDRIHATGHFAGINPRNRAPIEFHLSLRGFSQFLQKVLSLAVEKDDLPSAIHWKKWASLYQEGGESALREEYYRMMESQMSVYDELAYESTFRSLLTKDALSLANNNQDDKLKIDLPFASQVVNSRFEIQTSSGTQTRYLKYPINEAFLFSQIFKNEPYKTDSGRESCISSPDLIIDIGANIGLFSLYMKSIYPEAEVHAFEANKDTFSLLSYNLSSLERTTTYQFGWGDSDRSIDLYRHPFNSFDDSMIPASNYHLIPNGCPIRSSPGLFDEIFNPSKTIMMRIACNGNEDRIILSLGERLYFISILFLEHLDAEYLKVLSESLSPVFSLKSIVTTDFRYIACLELVDSLTT
ncbi:MAG TPA: FkbM family methyltransferase [Oligoflexia bacterium]|mgnify:CR=1 FL=1|nr:FkbM family methyltransferase [Oligoflexia bacterium]HMP48949.1 FkbM family methyltransferase [Oligoflexia bacterium]